MWIEYEGRRYNPETGEIIGKRGSILTGKCSKGYPMVKRHVHAHRWIFEAMGVNISEGVQVDHINHIRDDNRWSNLRLVTPEENARNHTLHNNNTSGVSGVSWCNTHSRWKARIGVDDKRVDLGSYVEYGEAVNARKNAEVLYGYHTNHGEVA